MSDAAISISRRNRSAPDRVRDLGPEHLDRYGTTVLEVVRQIHSRHSARTDFPLDSVAVSEGLFELRGDSGHSANLRPDNVFGNFGLVWRPVQ